MTTDERFRTLLAGFWKTNADVHELDARTGELLKLATVLAAYDLAKDDPNARLPTYLVAALEQLRRE